MNDHTVTLSDWERIVAKQVSRCEAGDQAACRWVAEHKPNVAAPAINTRDIDLSKLSVEQLRALAGEDPAPAQPLRALLERISTMNAAELRTYIAERLQAAWNVATLTDSQIQDVLIEHEKRTAEKRAKARARVTEDYHLGDVAAEIDPAG